MVDNALFILLAAFAIFLFFFAIFVLFTYFILKMAADLNRELKK